MGPILLHLRRSIRSVLDRTVGPSLVEFSSVGTNPLEPNKSRIPEYIDAFSLNAERGGVMDIGRKLLWASTRNCREGVEV
jgi:hypothetical protein